ncbi:MAG TPA: hypothetical protein VGT44_21710, partial [Ktedonobacteraceae bacterium]|nr:hypothetical protein [Ktedonobacteraceae bacterium]
MNKMMTSWWKSLSFARWSLRRRVGQFIPIAASFVLLVVAVQSIGALHDVSSTLVQQQIARSWRDSYDLLVRPQSAVSAPERGAGWIDPQSMLETYGGIDQQQLDSISTIAHVVQVSPVAMVGWQPVDVRMPLHLPGQGVYRVTATWSNQWASDTVAHYVDVTDLAHVVQDQTIASPTIEFLLPGHTPAMYVLTLQALQAIMGVSSTGENTLLPHSVSISTMRLMLRVERLRGGMDSLPGCVQRQACWEAQAAQQGTSSYQIDGVQLLRYTRVQYEATSQQLAAGQVTIVPAGKDTQGLLYRVPLTTSVALPPQSADAPVLQALSPVPFSMAERSSILPVTPHVIPLAEACQINGTACYSGVYVSLSDVDQYSQRSLALLQATAVAISARTGLHVDILDGSSLRTITFAQASQATASLQADWRVVGVAVQIAHGVDGLQATLLVLCSIVCLLSIGMAGVLVGIGRRKNALLLRQLGWQGDALALVFLCDALALCAPGCLLVVGWTIIATKAWPTSVPASIIWTLIGVGALVYCGLLVGSANLWHERFGNGKATRHERLEGNTRATARVPWYFPRHRQGRGALLRFPQSTPLIIQGVGNLAIALAVFLIVEGYVLMSGFNQALIVTILGKQVHTVLEGPQLLLLAVIIGAALLTVGFCSTLLLRGRRDEIQLLARIGWERGHVLLRLMRDSCSPAMVSGGIGVLAALGVAALVA